MRSAARSPRRRRARSTPGAGRLVAVGTTSLRLLESAADDAGTIQPFAGETDLFILPGHRFRAVDLLMTNFHLPRSTLFMLVCAFAGTERMRAAYAHAIEAGLSVLLLRRRLSAGAMSDARPSECAWWRGQPQLPVRASATAFRGYGA